MENTCYAKYLLKKFKDYGMEWIVVKNFLMDKDHHIRWCENAPQYGEKKCSWIGGINDNDHAEYIEFISDGFSTKPIPLYNEWKDYATYQFCISYESAFENAELLSNMFFQLMAHSERQDIYIGSEMLFAKGNAYMHLIEAELYA